MFESDKVRGLDFRCYGLQYSGKEGREMDRGVGSRQLINGSDNNWRGHPVTILASTQVHKPGSRLAIHILSYYCTY